MALIRWNRVLAWMGRINGIILVFYSLNGFAQNDSTTHFTLENCISYALANQAVILHAKLNEQVTTSNIRIALSGYYPQIDIAGEFRHYLQLPVVFFPDPANPDAPKRKISSGLLNTSFLGLTATQSLFNADMLYAGKNIRDQRKLSKQSTESVQIGFIVDVSKAFWDVLLSEQQLSVLDEDVIRLERNYQDARHLYENGLTDKIDYQQATITLNNTKVQQKNFREQISSKYAVLKETIGFPPEQELKVIFDSAVLIREINTDTNIVPSYDKRIEYQMLETNLNLQKNQTGYYRWAILPTLSAFYDYNLVWQNNSFSSLYNMDYPNSVIGLTLNLPLFRGANRLENLRKSKLQWEQIRLEQTSMKNQIFTDYAQTIGTYKSNYNAFRVAKENIDLAKTVFNTISLQYREGIKTYLNVIIADSDLRTAELNYFSALFQLLYSKIDLQRALGNIHPENY